MKLTEFLIAADEARRALQKTIDAADRGEHQSVWENLDNAWSLVTTLHEGLDNGKKIVRDVAPGIDIDYVRVYCRSKVDKLEYYIRHQKQWIEFCEANGRSYAGHNGPAIREADANELARLEAELAELPGRPTCT